MLSATGALAQSTSPRSDGQEVAHGSAGPGYPGPQVRISGIFVTPVPNAPFTATVRIVSHHSLPDGSDHVVNSVAHVARASSGTIYNESRAFLPAGWQGGEPRLLSGHVYDPSSRRNVYLDPRSHLARESTLERPPATTPGPTAPGPLQPDVVESDLGSQVMNGVELKGLRRTRTIPAQASGTGKPLTITDDFWYSPALSVYLIIRHDDPRTGEQLVAMTEVDAHEPNPVIFRVPDDYKIVDENPPQQSSARR